MSTNNCDYKDVIENKNMCVLTNEECNKHSVTNCEISEQYINYLTEMWVEVISRKEIEGLLNDSGTV